MKKLLVLLFILAPALAQADDFGKALADACLHKEVQLTICKNAQDSIKHLEKSTLAFIRAYDIEDPAAVLAFSVNTISKGSITIPQVIPMDFKNSLEVSSKSVYWTVGFNWP